MRNNIYYMYIYIYCSYQVIYFSRDTKYDRLKQVKCHKVICLWRTYISILKTAWEAYRLYWSAAVAANLVCYCNLGGGISVFCPSAEMLCLSYLLKADAAELLQRFIYKNISYSDILIKAIHKIINLNYNSDMYLY